MTRVSPYPLRERTPTQLLSPSAHTARRRAQVTLDPSPGDADHHDADHDDADQHQHQLVVLPLVKDTVGSRDTSATMLDFFASNGATFSNILHRLWERFCSVLRQHDRTYQGNAIVWRMWANEIMRKLDRSTWEVDVLDLPPATVERLLRAADGEAGLHLASLSRSTRLALDIVNGAIADNHQLKNDWEAFGRRLDNQENALKARRDTLEGFLEDILLPLATYVSDPESTMENIPDTEHGP
ncbi:hypothetical protein PHPALM_20346 [Phytophthora palmivora]|uniref:Uncharacterized protein n=1 Tax=Phytophthora palmivora TaxID=4796 RepID=A0A2P4XF47_9STRA|nr:hypothetical protein PHPALM_20346 [Phytophthora palmivora]